MIDMFQPIDDNVVVKIPENKEDRAFKIHCVDDSSRLVISTHDDKALMKGTVSAVGPGEYNRDGVRIPMSVKVGDKVCYSKYQCTELDKTHVLMKERQILGILKG